jgi:S-formylglutathione hydrolase FrmB
VLSRAALIALAVLALLAPAAGATARAHDGAYVVAQQQVAPRQVDLTIESPALGGATKVRLLTPDGWDDRGEGTHWPVLYLLHGCCDSYVSWTRSTDVADIQALHQVLVVMPEAGAAGWYTDFWNHGAGGPPRWETFHLEELPEILAGGYGAGSLRAIAGLSMGGFGALSYAARHPGMFRAAASFSGVIHPLADASLWLGFFGIGGQDRYAVFGDPIAQRDIWEAHDPYSLARMLTPTRLFIASGDGTAGGPFDPPDHTDNLEATIFRENVAVADRLAELHIPATLDFYGPGSHSWPYWQRELHRALPLLLDAIDPGDSPEHVGSSVMG